MRLFRILSVICVVSIVGMATLSSSAAEPAKKWHTSFPSAQAEAKRLNLPILLHFYADWCLPCRRMERDVLKSPELLKQLGDRVVAVKLNADRHQALVRRYDVRALPTDMFVDPDGRPLARNEGYRNKSSYLAQIAEVGARFASSEKVRVITNTTHRALSEAGDSAAEDQPPVVQDGDVIPDFQAGRPATTDTAEKTGPSIGLDGYSPVALAKRRKWRKGKAAFAAKHKGIIYYLASAEEHREFQADPQRYAPRLLGCDPVLLGETDRAIVGSIRYGAYYNGELYLFSNRENREQFKQHPKRYIQSRHVLRTERTRLR